MSDATLTARPWRGRAQLAALAATWDELARAADLDPLCNSHAWTLAYANAYLSEEQGFGWTLEQQGRPAAVLALRREPSRGPLALRRAIFLADGSFDSDYLAPPVRPGLERAAVGALIEAAARMRGLHALVFSGLPDDSAFLAALRAELDARGTPRREHPVSALAAALPDSFEDYLAGLKPRMRSKVRAAVRAAGESGARLEWCTQRRALGAWLETLFRLHGERWRAVGQPGSFTDLRRRLFYTDLAARALERDELCLARLRVGDATVAIQIGLRCGAHYYQLQEGFDPALEQQRVGLALRALALESLIERGVRCYDFMEGDAQHKRDWGGQPRPCTTLAFPLPHWRAQLTYRLRARLDARRR